MKMFKKKRREAEEFILKELRHRLSHLEETVEQVAQKAFEYNVNIEHVHIHDPVLEQLTFRLDELDISDISGALNLGNNFGVRVEQKSKASESEGAKNPREQQSAAKGSNRTSDGNESNKSTMKQTSSGFSFMFGQE